MRYKLFLFSILLQNFTNNLFSQTQKSVDNKKMKIVEMKQLDCKDEKCVITRWTKNEFDKKGNLLAEIEYNSDSTFRNYDTYSYNRKGKMIEHNEFDKYGVLSKKTIFEYDNLNDKKNEKIYNSENQLMEIVQIKYNAFDLKIEELYLNPAGNILKKTTYTYDNKGSLIERKTISDKNQIIQQRSYFLKYY